MWDTLLELYEVYLHNVGHIIMCTHIHVWGTTLLFIVMTLFLSKFQLHFESSSKSYFLI